MRCLLKSLYLLIIWNEDVLMSLGGSMLREQVKPTSRFRGRQSSVGRILEHDDHTLHTADYLYEVWFKEDEEEPSDDEVECMEDTIKDSMPILVKDYLVDWLGYDPTLDWGEVDMVELDIREREKIYKEYLKKKKKQEKLKETMEKERQKMMENQPTPPPETMFGAETAMKKEEELPLEAISAAPLIVTSAEPHGKEVAKNEKSDRKGGKAKPAKKDHKDQHRGTQDDNGSEQEPWLGGEGGGDAILHQEVSKRPPPVHQVKEKPGLKGKTDPKGKDHQKMKKKSHKKKKAVKETHLVEMTVFSTPERSIMTEERKDEDENTVATTLQDNVPSANSPVVASFEEENPVGSSGHHNEEEVETQDDEENNPQAVHENSTTTSNNNGRLLKNAKEVGLTDKKMKKKLRRQKKKLAVMRRWNGKFRIRAKCRYCNPEDLDHARRALKKKGEELPTNYQSTPDFQNFMEHELKKSIGKVCKEAKSQIDFGIFTYLGLERTGEEEEEKKRGGRK